MIRLRRRHGIAGTILIGVIAVGLALATVAQSGTRGSSASASVTPVQGTDVSSLQGASINWADVAQSDRFVAVKASEGNYYTDPDYASDVAGAAAAGLYVMPYVFANPDSSSGTGKAQADYAWDKEISTASPAYETSSLMLPVAVDLEADPYSADQCYGLTPPAMVAWIQSFISEMKTDSGKTPVIYTSTSWWQACTGKSELFSADPLWLASWGVPVPASLPWSWLNETFWQYSDSGTVAGIGGAVDLDSLGPTQTSAVGISIRNEHIQTLSSLATQTSPSGYSVTGLPTGLLMSPNGVLTGVPTAVGQYSVTVTTPTGAVPATMPFTWDVHGAITVANATSQSTEEGVPVSLAITASGPDQSAGFAASFSAAGLPPGLSISSAGLITGSPTASGKFTVTVTVTDTLGGSQTASFTWTVLAKPTAGSGTCLEKVGTGGAAKLEPEPCSTPGSPLLRPGNG